MTNSTWRKSSYSGSTEPDCVEVAALPHGIGLRDSKNPATAHLTVSPDAFTELLQKIKDG